ncbi:tryptophan 2,3-dioxygenase [Sphingomonas sp. Leaf4]|uniref:tryptophan 2,3-dioxygenase n=1 Tax=Sphingomonas sp. Leaf4 TaxID=2876553 RepID=UPI001E457759|nr:tryptophan 2,3-dioxygenase family protein [Sphingomonas sp. Leaf4]
METRETDRPAPPRQGPTYSSYLRLDKVLDAQEPLSETHDELLFIVIHQTSELWIKLCLHELEAARQALMQDRLGAAFKMMARVARVQQQLIQSWDVLATITPADYSAMRGRLGGSSGFQSVQYRLLEYMLGAKNAAMLAAHDGDVPAQEVLREALTRTSLYDEALRLLARRGFGVPADRLERDFTLPYQASAEVEAAWAQVYGQSERYWDLYELAEKLVDLEYRVQLWRFGHLKTIERIIGFKRGTGGSAGVPYLAKVVGEVFFPELLSVRQAL